MSELKYTATQMNNVLSNSQEYYTNWREAEKINKELRARIAELEGFIDRLIEVGDWLNAMHEDGVFVDELNAARTSWKLAVSDWQAMPSHVTNPLDSQGIVTRNGGEG